MVMLFSEQPMCVANVQKKRHGIIRCYRTKQKHFVEISPPPPLTYECLFSLGMCVKKKASYHFQVYILSSDYLLPNLFVSLRLSGSF